MNIYYTAKDIEELAAKGVTSLEVGARVFLTDFAYETAEQLGIKLVRIEDLDNKPEHTSSHRTASAKASQDYTPGRYNKPNGCQHGRVARSESGAASGSGSSVSKTSNEETTVNRLVDIMGKMIKRGD